MGACLPLAHDDTAFRPRDSACAPVFAHSIQREVLRLPQPGPGGPVKLVRQATACSAGYSVCAQMQGCPGPRTHVLEPQHCSMLSSTKSPGTCRCATLPGACARWSVEWELYLRRSPP